MAREKRKKRKKLNILRLAATLLIVVLFVICGFSVKTIIQLNIEKQQLKKTNAELIAQKEDLMAELKNVKDLDYIEEQARKQLKMIKPGEVLYVLDDKKTDSENKDGETNDGGN